MAIKAVARESQARSIKPKKETKSDLTRQRIIDAAAKIFAQKGYSGARLADIAEEAQARAGGIYYYFSSREELVEEVLARATRYTIHAVNKRIDELPTEAPVIEKIRAAIRGQISAIQAEEGYATAYIKIYSQVPDAIRDKHRRVLREFFDIWRRLISAGKANGELRDDIDPAVMRLVIIGSIQWSVEWANAGTSSPEKLADQISDMFLGGIQSKLSR
jgi:AcrR family transcriptional regulator